jgi:hypothetical protein
MHLESLRIINFRGYGDETISFAPRSVPSEGSDGTRTRPGLA